MSSYGWLAESTILPKKPRQIEEVGKASMVDLHAAVYATEEAVKRPDAGEQKRRQLEQRAAGPLGLNRNSGVAERSAADTAEKHSEDQRVKDALARKAELYDRMARGEAEVSTRSDGLVDFELKSLSRPMASDLLPGEFGRACAHEAAHPEHREQPARAQPELAPPPGAEQREASRLAWERASREELRTGTRAAESVEARAAGAAKRHAADDAVSRQTEASRAVASEQKCKRQRALDDRRALLRLKQEERERDRERGPEPHAMLPAPPAPPAPTAPTAAPAMPAMPAAPAWPPAMPATVSPALPLPLPPPPPASTLAPAYAPAHMPMPPPSYASQWQRMPPQCQPPPLYPPPPPPSAPPQHDLSQLQIMQLMGLPAAFTSSAARQAEFEAQQDAQEARVQETWARFNPYGR